MTLTIRILGTEVLHISTTPEVSNDPGDALTTPIGFVASAGDQRYELRKEL